MSRSNDQANSVPRRPLPAGHADSNAAPALFLLLCAVATLALLPGTRSLTDIKEPLLCAAALLVAALLAWRTAARASVVLPRIGTFALAAASVAAFSACTALWASHPWVVRYAVAERSVMLLFALVAAIVFRPSRWRLVAWFYLVFGAAVALAALAFHFARGTLHDIRIPMGNANLLAAVLLFPLAMGSGLLVRESRGAKRPAVFALVAALISPVIPAFVLCRAVSYWLGLAVFGAVFALLSVKRRLMLAAALALVGAVAFAGLVQAGYVERFGASKNVAVRAELWRRAAAMVRERPFLGWGEGNYFTDGTRFAPASATRDVRLYENGRFVELPLYRILPSGDSRAHNEYLQQAAEGGAAGLALYSALLAAAAGSALRARRQETGERTLLEAALALFATYLVTNALNPEVRFAEFGAHFWILVGLLASSGACVIRRQARFGAQARAAFALSVTALAAWAGLELCVRDYRSSREFARAAGLAEEGRPAEAAQRAADAARYTWDKALRARALYATAANWEKAGRLREAAGAYAALSGEVYSLGDTDFRLAQILGGQGAYGEAIVCLRRYISAHPEDLRGPELLSAIEKRSSAQPPRAEGANAGAAP